MLLADYIVCRTLRSLGLAPDVVAGHSFGEYPALVAAGAWSITDAIRCTWHRAAAISGASGLEGCMAATDASPALIEESIALLGAAVSLANYNAPEQTVISGRRKDVESVMACLKQAGHAVAKLQVPYPFHSPLMRPSADCLAEMLPEIPLRASEVPVISTASCRPMTQPDEFVRSLLDQLVAPVNYPAIVDRICEFRPALVVESGPRQVLTKLNQLNHRGNEPVFMAADDPRCPGAAALLGVVAQADCLGCLGRDFSSLPALPKPLREGRIVAVVDATERRRGKMRTTSHAPVREVSQPSEGDNGERAREEGVLAAARTLPAAATPETFAAAREPFQPSHLSRRQEEPAGKVPRQLFVPPQEASRPAADADELRKIMVAFVVEQTGYPEDIVELDADLEADLGIDSIKKAQLFGELAERFHIAPREGLSLDGFPTLRHVLNFLVEELGSRVAGEGLVSSPPAVVEEAADADELRKIMVAFVVEQTGYPEDIVELDADLEADLGIDSIKKAQLFGELAERFHIAPREGLSLDGFPTLRHVLNFLVEELGSRVADEGLAPPAPPAVAEEAAEAVAAVAPQWPQALGALRIEVLEGTPRENGFAARTGACRRDSPGDRRSGRRDRRPHQPQRRTVARGDARGVARIGRRGRH